MNKIKDIKELKEFILYLEKKYNLLDLEIDGIKPWQLKRVQIHYDLGKVCGVMDTPHTTISLQNKIQYIYSIIRSSIFFNPFFAKKTDVLVFPHSRLRSINTEYIDIYTHYFINKLKKNNTKFLEIENPHLGKHYKKNKPWRYHNDFILMSKNIFYKFIKLNNIDYIAIKKVEAEIERKIGIYALTNLLISTTKKYKIEYFLYKKLLKKLQPNNIYLVVSYSGYGSLIKAAKDLNIETIEFQHGNFSKYHLGYYFGEDKKQLEYFPNKFYVWNEYWKSLMTFPIKNKDIIINGFDYLNNRKNAYNHITKKSNNLIVLSQGVLGDRIAKKILDNWDYFQKFTINYKLHPGEYDRWKSYPSLLKLNEYKNITVVKDIDLYELFMSCEYQVGVFSTALSEGIEFGCKTILLDLPGIEEMYRFREIYTVEVI